MKTIIALGVFLCSVSGFAYEFAKDVPEAVKTQITTDLAFMKDMRGNGVSNLHKEIFGDVDGAAYGRFFEDRVTYIGMSSCGGGNAVACVIPLFGSSKIWLTKNYTQFSHPQIAKMMVVYHEARHTEKKNGNWPHARCPTPFKDKDGSDMKSIWTGASLAGEPACDETAFGSYGSSVILLRNVAKYCDNCSEKVQADAKLYGDDQFKRMIGAEAIQQIETDSAG